MKWEYKEETLEAEEIAGDHLSDYLNDHGDDGWELVVMTPIAFVMQFVWKRPIQEDIIEATEHINALMCELEIAVTTLGFDINDPDECGDRWSAYRAAEAYLGVVRPDDTKEDE